MSDTSTKRRPPARPRAPSKTAKKSQAVATKASRKAPAASAPPADPLNLKVVRDGFTMPKNEYEALKMLKARCLAQSVEVKKSELLRAGLRILAGLPSAELIKAIKVLPVIKTGRKKKS